MPSYPPEIDYSDKYTDKYYEYRHIILPKDLMKKLPKGRLFTESLTSAKYLVMETLRHTTV
jgi:cyclin-dependent kinase regulatory subunit CKS1